MKEKPPFKKGDKVICIKQPPKGCYQCKVGVIATVRKSETHTVWVEEAICIGISDAHACYHPDCFKLYKKRISFKTLQHS